MLTRVKILLVSMRLAPFVKRDLEILSKNYEVRVVDFDKKKLGYLVKSTLKMIRDIFWADITFSWFANIHSFMAMVLSKIFFKPSIVVVGGYDVACEPEINYGIMHNPYLFLDKIVKAVLKHSDVLIAFSDYSMDQIKHLKLGIEDKVHVVPLACDTEKYVPHGEKDNVAMTVCVVREENISRKGLLTFVEAAKKLPDVKFVLAGPHMDNSINRLREISPKNVEFTGYLSESELINRYQMAKIYLQLSYQEGEGAGGALGEAMACECIPIVSIKAVALKETVGDCGFYVQYGDIQSTVDTIKKTIVMSADIGKRARTRMVDLFSANRRE
jgi:glycosyltransferase involved in cell wall biosynthesis